MNTIDPLTPEARETVERIRAERGVNNRDFDEYEQLEEAKDFDRLLAIIDNLPAPKQYTEEELRIEFQEMYPLAQRRTAKQIYTRPHNWIWQGWLEVARHFGLIKPEDQCQKK